MSVYFLFLSWIRPVNSWQGVRVEMRGDSGRKLLRKFTRMLTGCLKSLARHMQYYQILLRFAINLFETWDFLCINCFLILSFHHSSSQLTAFVISTKLNLIQQLGFWFKLVNGFELSLAVFFFFLYLLTKSPIESTARSHDKEYFVLIPQIRWP